MLTFIIRRCLAALPALASVTVTIFLAVRLLPGDPAVTLLGEGATSAQIAALRAQLRLDEPLADQFVGYVSGLFQGDLGSSLRSGRPIVDELALRLPATIELSLAALVLALLAGVPLGLLSAVQAHRPADYLARLLALLGISAPVFWLALFAQICFALILGWLPVSGRLDPTLRPERITGFLLIDSLLLGDRRLLVSALRHLILPASVLAAFLGAALARLIRASVLDELEQDYARTARAKGLREGTILHGHVLRNALLPAVTFVGLKLAELLGGAILTETVFAWPGMGRYMFEAIKTRDYPVIQGGVLLFAVVFVISSLFVDLAYGLLNPRIRLLQDV